MAATAQLTPAAAHSPGTERTQSNFTLGQETISAIRGAYEKGEYDSFLQEMDAAYEQALVENALEGLIQTRQKSPLIDFEAKWEQPFLDLQKQKNQALLKAVSDQDDSIFAKKVRSLAAHVSTPEQEKAIFRLNNLVAMAPNSGNNGDENTLINIDLEYEYKLLHVDVPASDLSLRERQSQHIALRMEKMAKMVAAAKTFQDHELKKSVGLAAANLDARLIRNIDGADLNAFAKGNDKASNALEEKVAEILSSYQGQFSDLMKGFSQ